MNQDLVRIIDSICRDKNIDRSSFIADLEAAMTTAIRKAYETAESAAVRLDPMTGQISAEVDGQPVEMQVLGRIAAMTAKQVIMQKTRERERLSIFEEFTERRDTIITGTVVRSEGGNLLVNLGRAEGFLPRSEQIPGETHQVGERIRVMILEVREQPNQVKIILSRSHPKFIERLFELEVPEVAEKIIDLKALAREAGYRTKIAVSSIDSKVDAVGACVGVRGSRIKNIVEELGGEKIDIVRWNESSQILIQNALKPAEVQEIALCFELGKATVVVAEDQLSLAIGKRGQNVRLASRLTGWDIDILTPEEYNKHLESLEKTLRRVEGVDDLLIDKLVAMGCVSVGDVDEIGPDPLVEELELAPELAEKILEAAGEEVIRQEEEREAAEKAKAAAIAAGVDLSAASAESEATESAGASRFVPAEDATAEAPAAAEAAEGETLDESTPPGAESGFEPQATATEPSDVETDVPSLSDEVAEPTDFATQSSEPVENAEDADISEEAGAPAPAADDATIEDEPRASET